MELRIELERRTVYCSKALLFRFTLELHDEGDFMSTCCCVGQTAYSDIVAVSKFEQALLNTHKSNEGIAVTVPQTGHEWTFLEVHTQINLPEVLLLLEKNVRRNFSRVVETGLAP